MPLGNILNKENKQDEDHQKKWLHEEVFDIRKIVIAVTKADSSSEGRSLTDSQIEDIAEFVEFKCNKLNRAVSVEEIQDMVENQIMATGAFELARKYVRYATSALW